MKKKISTLLITGALLGQGGIVLAEVDPEEVDGTTHTSTVTTEIIPGDDITDPSPGPETPIEPPDTNPGTDRYGIRYVSNLDFGQMKFSTRDETIKTQYDATLKSANGPINSYVHIRDIRAASERGGWHVTVQQDSEFIPGSSLTFSPSFSDNSEGFNEDDFTIPTTLEISKDPITFMSTVTAENPAGTAALVEMGEAELHVPANSGTGSYTTNLIWNLVAGPDETL